MPLEMELKLKVPDKLTAERLCGDPKVLRYAQEPLREKRMEALYFDTASHALTQQKWMLRIRCEDDCFIAACKRNRPGPLENGFFCRDEWECAVPCADNPAQAAGALVGAGAPAELLDIIGAAPLVERCRILFTRRCAVLRLPEGLVCEFSLDEGVITAGGKTENMLEMELEVLYGKEAAAVELCAVWALRYNLTYEYASKYERGLRLIRSRQI